MLHWFYVHGHEVRIAAVLLWILALCAWIIAPREDGW